MAVDWIGESYRLGRVKCLLWSIRDNVTRIACSYVYRLFMWSMVRLLKFECVHTEIKLLILGFLDAWKGIPIFEHDNDRLRRMERDVLDRGN